MAIVSPNQDPSVFAARLRKAAEAAAAADLDALVITRADLRYLIGLPVSRSSD